jgi:hypothetical protein
MWLNLSAVAFAVGVLVHAVTLRLAPRAGAVTAFVAIGGAVGAGLIGYCVLKYGLTPTTMATVLAYAFAGELYIFLFTLVGNSVSFGLMARLARRPLEPAEIADFYRTEAMIERRLDQLERANFIVVDQAGLRLTMRGQRIAKGASILRSIFRRAESGRVTNGLRGR